MTRANDIIGWFVLAVVVPSPIPLGGNPPVFWAISGMLVGICTMAYFGWAALGRRAIRFPLRAVGVAGGLWLLLLLWLLVQMLPLGAWLGPLAFATPGGVVEASRLSLAPGSSWMMLIRWVSYGLLFLLAAQAGANEARTKWMLSVMFWAIVLHAVFGLFQLTQLNDTLLGFEKKYYAGVATGTFVNRNSYASFLAMGLAIGGALLARAALSRRGRSAAVVLAGMLVMAMALMASQSRMGAFAALVGLLAVALLALRWLPGSRLAMLGLVGVVLGAAAVWVFGQGLLERLVDIGGSGTGREVIYQQVMAMIATRPWLGFGGGAFELAFPLFYGPPLGPDMLIDKAHSTYLTLIVELGVVGALLPIGAVALLFGRVVRRYWAERTGAAVLLAGIGVVIVGATHSTVDFSLEMQANAYLLTAVLGLATAQASASRR